MTSWRDGASCANNLSPEEADALFYPATEAEAKVAKAMCERCSVLEICLEDAMRMEGGSPGSARFGIRGGLDPLERAALHSRRVRAKWREGRSSNAR